MAHLIHPITLICTEPVQFFLMSALQKHSCQRMVGGIICAWRDAAMLCIDLVEREQGIVFHRL